MVRIQHCRHPGRTRFRRMRLRSTSGVRVKSVQVQHIERDELLRSPAGGQGKKLRFAVSVEMDDLAVQYGGANRQGACQSATEARERLVHLPRRETSRPLPFST